MTSLHLFNNKAWEQSHPSVMHYAKLPKTKVQLESGEDSSMLAIAACFIDLIEHKQLSQPARNDILNTILTTYYSLFNNVPIKNGLETAFERIRHLISFNKNSMNQLVANLAYTFRQLAIHEISQNPENYRGLLKDPKKLMDLSQLTVPGTSLGETGIVALAKVLSMPITVREIEKDKDLSRRVKHNEHKVNMLNPGIVLYLDTKTGIYSAAVVKGKLFTQYVEQSISQDAIDKAESNFTPKQLEVKSKLHQQDAKMKKDYNTIVQRIRNALDNGAITQDALLELYVKNAGYVNEDIVSRNYLETVFDDYYFESIQ